MAWAMVFHWTAIALSGLFAYSKSAIQFSKEIQRHIRLQTISVD
jgi:hypothetical protein